MSAQIERKPHGDSVLKGRSPARQQALFEYMEGFADEKGHTYKECVEWLKSDGLETNKSQLCTWRKWYLIRTRLDWNHDLTSMLVEDDKMQNQKYTDAAIQRKGNHIFSVLAIQTCDDKAWSRVRSLQVRQQAVAAIERRLELEITKYEDQRARTKAVAADPIMTPEQKEERIRQILGTD